MVYESNYRPAHNTYGDELMHYGVPGMKWGRRKAKTAAAIYGMNARAYSKSNKTLASMNRDAQKKQLAKVADYDKQIAARKNSPEYKAKVAKTKKVAKIGAAVAGTALAAYGAYKVSKVLKDKASAKSYATGRAEVKKWLELSGKQHQVGNWQQGLVSLETARDIARNTDARTKKVQNSTVEAAKYLYKTRKG